MRRFSSLMLLFFSALSGNTQEKDTIKALTLETITIKAYEQQRKLREVPAAINYVGKDALNRFSPTAVVQAVNTTPGVRMEERSPGSYRFNIRGSSLRSPFGVRNVKVYYNDIPFTDPGGQTYLNVLGYYNFGSIEIIKGPGSSLYGAGTGGVLLIESLPSGAEPAASMNFTGGSYGLKAVNAAIASGSATSKNKIGFQHLQSHGYRDHAALKRNSFNWDARFRISERDEVKTSFLYSSLFYETPGALTKAEYDAAPKLSRPAGGGFPSAIQSEASIQQKMFLAGISYTHRFSESLTNSTVAYGLFAELRNPAIRNYGKNTEPHTGGRTVFNYSKKVGAGKLNLTAGAEAQKGFATITVYKNRNGVADTLQTEDDVSITQSLGFLQAVYSWKNWEVSASSSLNFYSLQLRRMAPAPLPLQTKNYSGQVAPRLALSKKWKSTTLYGSVAKGFSPPTSAELVPSGSAVNLELSPEEGVNYEVGLRTSINGLMVDVNAFRFALENTIVQRRDAGGGDYFVNAGKTKQLGIETSIMYPLLRNSSSVQNALFWLSHTWHRFTYKEFTQLTSDYSGKRLPGIAPHTISTGVDILLRNGFTLNVNYFFSDAIPLNDANNESAAGYHLLNGKIGFQTFSKWPVQLSVGVDNILDQKYSLGNDINAFGGRYYNAAARRAIYISLGIGFVPKKPTG